MPETFPPDPHAVFPIQGYDKLVFLKNVISRPNISVGRYTYYDATGRPGEKPEDFEANNVLYHFDFIGDKLIIGAFCCIGSGAAFIMNGANHEVNRLSAFPFSIFGNAWSDATSHEASRGDTVVGNDVWIGYGAVVLPGRNIGHGAIIGAKSVVTRDVPPYHIVGGNPAQIIRPRFPQRERERLLEVSWWDWPIEKITRNLDAISRADVTLLEERS